MPHMTVVRGADFRGIAPISRAFSPEFIPPWISEKRGNCLFSFLHFRLFHFSEIIINK